MQATVEMTRSNWVTLVREQRRAHEQEAKRGDETIQRAWTYFAEASEPACGMCNFKHDLKKVPGHEHMPELCESHYELVCKHLGVPFDPISHEEILFRYPRLAAHLICESAGYLCPDGAAMAIKHHKAGTAFWCEWYQHMARREDGETSWDPAIKRVGEDVMAAAIRNRSRHQGYMAEIMNGYGVVARAVLHGCDPGMLASWF